MKAIAVIPARGGSKRIPRKNIRDFAGKPAIAWAIDAALATNQFSRVVVSTDDAEIAEVSQRFGAETPFVRPADLSDDYTSTTDVIRDAVVRLGVQDDAAVCCIYPTALLLDPADLIKGQELLQEGADWVMAVAEYATPIDRAYRKVGSRIQPRDPSKMAMRSQDLEPAFFDVGQFYWAYARTWQAEHARVWDGAAAVEIPINRAIDIDTESDWERAEAAYFAMAGTGA